MFPAAFLLACTRMRTTFCLLLLLALALPAAAAERIFDFGLYAENQAPPGFRSTVTGQGKAGDWRILLDAVAPLLAPLTERAPDVARRAVLAQVATDPTDEHFPLLIYEEQTFGDFTLTTRFKTVSGTVERMAGIAFRIQDERNYYVVRASSLGNTFRFYKVLNGDRGPLVGPEIPISSGTWHELTVECKGNAIRCLLDGKEQISVTDKVNPFTIGKIGFWTKSDSVSYFTDTKIVYTPREPPAQAIVRSILQEYPRLLGLQVYVADSGTNATRRIASGREDEVGAAGGDAERNVLSQGATYYGKTKESVSVVLPLRDRNGDVIAAVRVVMKTFAGQTEQNAIIRATPIVRQMQQRVQTLQDLVE